MGLGACGRQPEGRGAWRTWGRWGGGLQGDGSVGGDLGDEWPLGAKGSVGGDLWDEEPVGGYLGDEGPVGDGLGDKGPVGAP